MQLTLSQSFFSSCPFTVAMCTCRFFSCLFTRPSIPQNHVSLHPLPFSHTHIVYSNLKDSPRPVSCKLLVPLFILSPSLFLLPFSSPPPPSLECLDRSKWCDCDCSAGRLPLSVFGKSDVSRGREEREKAEQEREREGGKFF